MKSVLEHLNNIDDPVMKQWCLLNLDKTKQDLMCYAPGFAMMLGVNQPDGQKDYWQEVCHYLNTGKLKTTPTNEQRT